MSLMDMVQKEDGDSNKELKLDLDDTEDDVQEVVSSNENEEENNQKKTKKKTSRGIVFEKFPLIPLHDWFDKYHRVQKTFEPKIKATSVQIADALESERLVVSILHPNGGTHPDTGNPLRKMVTFDGSNEYHVIDAPGIDMDFYGDNCARIIYHLGEFKYVKCYCVASGLRLMFATLVEGRLIPHSDSKIPRSRTETHNVVKEPHEILQRLNVRLDKEALIILYRQFQKVSNQINSKMEAIDWLIEKTKQVSDINHQILIDRAMMSIVK